VVGDPPPALGAVAVRYPSASGSTIHAWLVSGRPGGGSVLLLHGAGENRRVMLARAAFLHAAGFTVLAPDFQAHGESPGAHETYGALERHDVQAGLAFLRACAPIPDVRVGVIGISMGGAAVLLDDGPIRPDAVVLESVYPTIHQAVADRLEVWLGPLGGFGPALAPALVRFVGDRIGVAGDMLRPLDRIGGLTAPVFVLGGTADRFTRLDETRALYRRARAPKQLWEVPGAGHEDLLAFAGAEYERRVGGFLARYLAAPLVTVASARATPAACTPAPA